MAADDIRKKSVFDTIYDSKPTQKHNTTVIFEKSCFGKQLMLFDKTPVAVIVWTRIRDAWELAGSNRVADVQPRLD